MSIVCVMLKCPSKDWMIFGCSPREESCREGVTQGVEGEAFAIESGSLVQRLVLAEIEVVVIRVAADTVGEDEALILPAGFCLQLLVLACLVDTESGVIGGIHSLPPRLCA